jgi:hypothetical protein
MKYANAIACAIGLLLVVSFVVTRESETSAHHGSLTYCDRWHQRILQDAQIDLIGDQLKWVMNQRICVWDTVTAHWKLTTVRSCADFRARINNPPFVLTAYEKSAIVRYAGC